MGSTTIAVKGHLTQITESKPDKDSSYTAVSYDGSIVRYKLMPDEDSPGWIVIITGFYCRATHPDGVIGCSLDSGTQSFPSHMIGVIWLPYHNQSVIRSIWEWCRLSSVISIEHNTRISAC